MKYIFHITHFVDWEFAKAAGEYTADSLDNEGFIHCSLEEQVAPVANNFFKGEKDLLLLVIDEARVQAKIKYEDLQKEGKNFPHIYGPLNLDAVIKSIPFPAEPDGTFRLPPNLLSESRFASTPKPPYFAVIFSSQRSGDDKNYQMMSDRMVALAKSQPGYLGVESTRDTSGFGITVSYWDSLENIASWKRNVEHTEAQEQGRKKWYDQFQVRITRVEREYSF